jgi:hypothetical protein
VAGLLSQDAPDLAMQRRNILAEDVPDHPVVNAGVAMDQDVAQCDDPARPVSLGAMVGSTRDSLPETAETHGALYTPTAATS